MVQIGTPKDIFMRPATAAVAGFIGTPPMNLLPAMLVGGQVQVSGYGLPVTAAPPGERDVTLGVRPGDLRVAERGFPARVDFVEDLGDSLIVHLTIGEHRVKIKSGPNETPLVEGQPVHLAFAPKAAHLFDRITGERL